MAISKGDAIHILSIILRYMNERLALTMLCDMDFEIAEITDNPSLKESIKMVRRALEG